MDYRVISFASIVTMLVVGIAEVVDRAGGYAALLGAASHLGVETLALVVILGSLAVARLGLRGELESELHRS